MPSGRHTRIIVQVLALLWADVCEPRPGINLGGVLFMAIIKRITVRAGRVVPHPLYSYGNVKSDLEIVADLEDGDDPEKVRQELQAKVESDVEQHVSDLKEGIRDLQGATEQRERIKRLEAELTQKTEELNAIKADFSDRPLLAPKK